MSCTREHTQQFKEKVLGFLTVRRDKYWEKYQSFPRGSDGEREAARMCKLLDALKILVLDI